MQKILIHLIYLLLQITGIKKEAEASLIHNTPFTLLPICTCQGNRPAEGRSSGKQNRIPVECWLTANALI
jgi:hypothetical protein